MSTDLELQAMDLEYELQAMELVGTETELKIPYQFHHKFSLVFDSSFCKCHTGFSKVVAAFYKEMICFKTFYWTNLSELCYSTPVTNKLSDLLVGTLTLSQNTTTMIFTV